MAFQIETVLITLSIVPRSQELGQMVQLSSHWTSFLTATNMNFYSTNYTKMFGQTLSLSLILSLSLSYTFSFSLLYFLFLSHSHSPMCAHFPITVVSLPMTHPKSLSAYSHTHNLKVSNTHTNQCDQIWRNFANVAKLKTPLANFKGFH